MQATRPADEAHICSAVYSVLPAHSLSRVGLSLQVVAPLLLGEPCGKLLALHSDAYVLHRLGEAVEPVGNPCAHRADTPNRV